MSAITAVAATHPDLGDPGAQTLHQVAMDQHRARAERDRELPTPPPTHPLAAAIRAELRARLEAPAVFNHMELAKIVRFAEPAMRLLEAIDEPGSAGAALRRFGLGGGGINLGSIAYPAYEEAPGTENFGVKAIREVVEAARGMNNKPTSSAQQVQAILNAREAGMDDVAEELARRLRKDLGLIDDEPEPPMAAETEVTP